MPYTGAGLGMIPRRNVHAAASGGMMYGGAGTALEIQPEMERGIPGQRGRTERSEQAPGEELPMMEGLNRRLPCRW